MKTKEERKQILDEKVMSYAQRGWMLISRDNDTFSASMQRKNTGKPNHVLHIVLVILTGFIWVIPYIFILATANNAPYIIDSFSIDEDGDVRNKFGQKVK